MKKVSYFLILILPFFLNAQKVNSGVITGSGDHNNRYLDMFQEMKKNINTPVPLSQLEGSPYLKEEFTKGQIFEADSTLGSYYLRYNIFNEVMELLTEEETIMELRKSPELKIFLNNKRFRVLSYINPEEEIQEAYFEILEDGERYDLLKKHFRSYKPGERAKTSYHIEKNPEIESAISYYVHFNNENLPVEIEKLNERNLAKALKLEKKKISSISKKNDLDLRTIEDVGKLVALLNQNQ